MNYILDGETPVECTDIMKWAKWRMYADPSIAKTKHNGVLVSTVFLGMDLSFGNGPPLLYETMIFNSKYEKQLDYQERYPTREAALLGHTIACNLVFPGTNNDK